MSAKSWERKRADPKARPSASSVKEFVDYFRLRINISPPKAKASKEMVDGSGTTVTVAFSVFPRIEYEPVTVKGVFPMM